MVKLNLIYIFSVYMHLSILVLESHSKIPYRNRGCPIIQLDNGRVKLRSGGRVARITCNRLFKLVQGSEIMTCVRGEWDTEFPICARTGCTNILHNVPHGKLILVDEAKLEIECDVGFVIDGLSFTYCNESVKWNDELKGCKANDRIYSSCDFESSDGRLCGWQNDRFNDVDWLADKMSFAFYPNRRHVTPGSSQYFSNNYISLDAGNYGSSTFGKLISPQIPPVESKQRCLIFSYKVISGTSHGAHTLTVTFGNIPHWTTSEAEGRVIIGLYKFNISSQIIIEGKSCKAAIDNIIVTEGYSCSQKPYEDEPDTCHDNCGKTSYDDNSCSCDWECNLSDNCCSDISTKCPYIKPFEEINRLYLTTATPITVKKIKYIYLNHTTSTLSNISLKIINESNISNDSVIASTPMNEYNVTVDKITNPFTQTTNTPQIHFSYNMKTTEKPIDTPILNYTLISNNSSFFHSTSLKTTAMSYLDTITNITTTPKLMDIHDVTATMDTKPTTVDTMSVNHFNSTIKPLVMTTTYTSRVLNTFNATTKSLMGNQFSYFINRLNSTIISTTNNTTLSTKTNHSPNNTTITTIVPTTNHEREKSINTLNSTIQPPMTTTPSIIVTLNTTAETVLKNSTISTKLINLYSTRKIPPFTHKFNERYRFKLFNNTFTKTSLNVQNVTQNDVITESKIKINNSPTHIPNINYTVPNEDMITIDINKSNLNLSHFIYETNTLSYIHNSTLMKNNKSPFDNNSIPNETTQPTMLNSDSSTNEHMKKNDYSRFFSVSNFVIIVKYLAAIGIIVITVKFSFSFIRWYFKKPNDDDMNSCFIKTDNESACNMELKSHHT